MMPRKPIWWLPLLRRVFRWGATSALLVIAPVLLVVLPSLLLSESSESGAATHSLSAVLYAAGLLSLGAFVTGACSGFCAPVSESENPLRSRFFGQVAGETFVFSMGLLCVGQPIAVLVLVLLGRIGGLPLLNDGVLSGVAALLIFPLSLGATISRALRASKSK